MNRPSKGWMAPPPRLWVCSTATAAVVTVWKPLVGTMPSVQFALAASGSIGRDAIGSRTGSSFTDCP